MFGGSFDPPHQGHQHIVQSAMQNLGIDKLLVVPAYLSPFKISTLASAQKRLAWCHTLFDSIKDVIVDDYEIQEAKSISTSQSVKHFNTIYTLKYLIVGADNLSTLTQWQNFEWLNQTVIWVIIPRDTYALDTQALRSYKVLELGTPISSSQIRTTQDLAYVDSKIRHSVKDILKGFTSMIIEERIEGIVKILDDKKAEEIEVFNLEDADYIAKRVVIANSLNGKHTLALFEHLKKGVKELGDTFLASDISDEWAVADLGDILIHVMIPEYRQRYSLETFLSELVANQKNQAQ